MLNFEINAHFFKLKFMVLLFIVDFREAYFIMISNPFSVATTNSSQVYLEIDNRLCFKYEDFKCFGSTDHIAQFVAAALLNDDFKPPVAVHQIGSKLLAIMEQ